MSDAPKALTGPLVRLGLGLAAASQSAVFLYAVLRLVQARLFPEADPATIIWSAHAGYFWRCLTVLYAGTLVGFLGYGPSAASPASVARALLRALPWTTGLILAQGLLVP